MLNILTSRWKYAIIFALINLILGNSYSYSFIRPVIEKEFGINSALSGMPLIALLISFCVLMFFNSNIVAKFGNIKTFYIGLAVLAVGYIGSGFVNNIELLTLFFGVISGAGIGILYSSTLIATGLIFPDKKGLAMGITTSGFGLSPLFVTFVFSHLIANFGLSKMFLYLGSVSSVLILILITQIKIQQPQSLKSQKLEGLDTQQMLSNNLFWAIYLCFTIAMMSGLIVVGTTAPLAIEILGMSKANTAFLVAFLALPNFFGRIFYGFLTSKFQLKTIGLVSFLLTAIASAGIASGIVNNLPLFGLSMAIIWSSFGGWLSLSPTAIAKFFGAKHYAKNYGLTFTGYGLGGLIGIFVTSYIQTVHGNYATGYWIITALSSFGMIITLWLKSEQNAVQSKSQIIEDNQSEIQAITKPSKFEGEFAFRVKWRL